MDEPDLKHFQSISWCSELLKDPAVVITPTLSRQPKDDKEDSLTAITLQTDETISKCLTFYKRPPPGESFITEVCSLMTLGAAMNGGPHMLHGGIIATLMDDVMGTLLTINKDSNAMPLSIRTVTGTLNIRFMQRVKTPGTVLVVAKCRDVKGRKYFMEAEVRSGTGEVFARADSLWIRVADERL
jgi:acyl-coenzyme A thioesterase PaaI-like protein